MRPTPEHPGFARVFAPGRMTLGVMLPMAPLTEGFPDMTGQLDLAARADALGFAALWSRDVPLFDPGFGDAGQIYDPWVWLGQLAAVTRRITLSTAGIVLPLRHPLHTAKAAASLDVLSGGRFVLGAASGDRAAEYAAFGVDHESRGHLFREAVFTIRSATEEAYPRLRGRSGNIDGLDTVPKPPFGRLPMLAVGSARQSTQWIAENVDGWITYLRDVDDQRRRIDLWKSAVAQRAGGAFRPFAQSLFIDLIEDPGVTPTPIILGYRLGRDALLDHLEGLHSLGVNHVTFNLRHSARPAADVLGELAAEVLPRFASHAPAGLAV